MKRIRLAILPAGDDHYTVCRNEKKRLQEQPMTRFTDT
jgi:hypothetical protein